MCANSKFLNETLRNTWGFDGYVTSDCDAVGDVYSPGQRRFSFVSEAFSSLEIQKRHLDIKAKWSNFGRFVVCEFDVVVWWAEPEGHGYASPVDGTAMALKAGTDMDCGDWGKKACKRRRHFLHLMACLLFSLSLSDKTVSTFSDLTQLPAAVKAGKVTEADLDKALLRLTTLQMELGLFDPKADSHFFTLGVDLIHSDEHTRHALEASRQSIVLLKNEGQVLPLKKGSSVAVLGPHSDGHDVFLSSKHQGGFCGHLFLV